MLYLCFCNLLFSCSSWSRQRWTTDQRRTWRSLRPWSSRWRTTRCLAGRSDRRTWTRRSLIPPKVIAFNLLGGAAESVIAALHQWKSSIGLHHTYFTHPTMNEWISFVQGINTDHSSSTSSLRFLRSILILHHKTGQWWKRPSIIVHFYWNILITMGKTKIVEKGKNNILLLIVFE